MQVRVEEPYKLIDRGAIRSARTPQQISDVPHDAPESCKPPRNHGCNWAFWAGLVLIATGQLP